MEDGNPDDWLPQGWRVQVNVRKNGKKDKWYFPPTGGAKFYSKLEVARYLKSNSNGINNGDSEVDTSNDSNNLSTVNNARSSNNINMIDSSTNLNTAGNITTTANPSTPSATVKHSDNLNLVNINNSNIVSTSTLGKNLNNSTDGSHPKSEEEEENVTLKRSSKQVTFEKGTAEGLPPGWTKKVKLTKKGSKIRRDPYYTDPENAYTFRSLKDAVRYVQTGEVGRLAVRRKEATHHEDAEDDETLSPASAKKQKTGTDMTTNSVDQSLKVSEVEPVGNNLIFKVAEVAPLTLKATEPASAVVSESLHEEKEIETTPPEAKPIFNMQPVEQYDAENHETEKHSTTGKSKKKNDAVQLPRRASKRLAGLPLAPTTSEPEASPPSHQAAAALNSEAVATVLLDSTSALKTPSQQQPSEPTGPKLKITHPYHNTSSEARKASTQSNNSKLPETGKKPEGGEPGKQPLNSPLGELWEDPCIAFAIKTLTGSLDDLPLGSTNNGLGNPAASKEDIATPEVSSPKSEHFKNSHDPGSPVNMSAAYTWSDPCIEFAIKTLTGAIPLESDLFNKEDHATSSQQAQPNSSQVFHQSTIFPTEAAAVVEPMSLLPQARSVRYTGGSSPSVGMGRRVTRSQRRAM